MSQAERLRRLRAEKPGWSTQKNRKWQAANREKYLAHKAVEYAVKSGKIARSPCEKCGAERVEAHHDDYSSPLAVRWLCRRHHIEAHRLISSAS